MRNKKITIRMPKEFLQKWLEALRSGKYEQGRARLRTYDGKYCCLGVMQHCLTGSVENQPYTEKALALPSGKWLENFEVQFYNLSGYLSSSGAPFLPSLNMTASEANDEGDYNFEQIADAIEDCAEGI